MVGDSAPVAHQCVWSMWGISRGCHGIGLLARVSLLWGAGKWLSLHQLQQLAWFEPSGGTRH